MPIVLEVEHVQIWYHWGHLQRGMVDALDTVVGVAFLPLLRIMPRRLNQTGALKTVLDSSIHSPRGARQS